MGAPVIQDSSVDYNKILLKPEIFNTDQGSQFTSTDFTAVLKDAKVKNVVVSQRSHTGHISSKNVLFFQ